MPLVIHLYTRDGEKDILVCRTPDSPIVPPAGLPSDWLQKCPTSVLENILLHARGTLAVGTKWFYKSELLWCDRRTLALVCKRFRVRDPHSVLGFTFTDHPRGT